MKLPKDQWALIRGLRRDVDALKRRTRGYTTVQDTGTALTVRDTINFTGATVTDDATNNVTNVAMSGGGVESLFLWSSDSVGDSGVTVPAYTGSGGSYTVEYAHMASTSTFWNLLKHNGSTVVSPLVDFVLLNPGFYLIDAWWIFDDYPYDSWLAGQLVTHISSGGLSSLPDNVYTDVAQVFESTVRGGSDPQNAGYSGQLETGARTLWVPPANTGGIHTELFHNDNRSIALDANWTLGIHKLS